MQLHEKSVIELYGDAVHVSVPSQTGITDYKLRYNEHPELRDEVQALLVDLVQRHQWTLFRDVCGRCGNSCRRPGVLMREQEVFRIRTHFELTEEDFRRDYLDPAPTWNEGDGFIRLKNGACPFFEEGAHGTPSRCAIHEIRPLACRNFASDAPICRKTPARLIEELAWVQLEEGRVQVGLLNGERQFLENEQAFAEKLKARIEQTDAEAEERLRRLSKRTGEILRELITEFAPEKVDAEYHRTMAGLRALLGDLGSLDKDNQAEFERHWADLCHLEDLVAGRVAPPAFSPPLKKRRGSNVLWLQLTEDSVTALYDLPKSLRQPGQPEQVPVFLGLHQYPQLRPGVTAFIHELLTRDDDDFQKKLTEADPPCFLCGECCRAYFVEITPTDVDRLALHFNMAPSQFEAEYTEPGRFSWNPGNRILNKSDHEQRYADRNPRLFPLEVVGQRDRSCVFLREREDGSWVCGVYQHRPTVCRRYTSNNSLCRKMNQLRHWGRQARNLVWVRVEPKQVSVMPSSTVSTGGPPDQFPRRKWRRLDELARGLEAEVDEILERARRELEAGLSVAR